jgi:hypothetical protein
MPPTRDFEFPAFKEPIHTSKHYIAATKIVGALLPPIGEHLYLRRRADP